MDHIKNFEQKKDKIKIDVKSKDKKTNIEN